MKKTNKLAQAMALGSVAAILAACGGGGGGGGSESVSTPSLQLSGTAATGAALANAAVEVKCAAGSGSATTTANGSYSLSISGATLPCLVRVTSNGGAIVLHSAVDTGSSSGSTTTATANVTPLTELIVAQLSAAMPAEVFAAFDAAAAGQLTPAKLTSATTAVVAALKDAGIDLGSIDPFKAQLVAATGTSTGNSYDQLLDQLGDKVAPEALPQLVTQVANAAATQSTSGLGDAMTAVEGGSLPGCPQALSGKYRTIDYFGKAVVREVNFKAGTFQASNGTDNLAIVQDATNPCAFTASAVVAGQTAEWQVAFAPGGVGTYRARFTAPDVTPGTVGYIFPVQSHAYSELAGKWTMLQSGFLPGEGVVHSAGEITLNADRSAPVCDYEAGTFATCTVDADAQLTIADRTDGGFNVNSAGITAAQVYGYRSPAGTLTLFGTTNAAGATTPDAEQTSLVLVKPVRLSVPAVGTVTRYAETQSVAPAAAPRSTTPVVSETTTIQSADASAGFVTRIRASDSRVDTIHYNQPREGWRKREAGATFAEAYQLPLPGLQMTVTINTEANTTKFYSISAIRP